MLLSYLGGILGGFGIPGTCAGFDVISHLLGHGPAAISERKINILVIRIAIRLHMRIIIDRRGKIVVHMFKENILEINGPCVSQELQSLEKIQ